mgnify:CR=1 FL=1
MRTLKANEIEVRVGHKVKNTNNVSMLLYIDSRAVTKYLDEWVGPFNWQTEFNTAGPLVVGKLGIWDDNKQQWVWKSDTGSESNIEAEKGLISDTYKRLLSRWGVTELYTAPDIVLPDDGYNNSGYKVSEIDYDENRNIIHLVITNRFGKELFRWDIGNKTTPIVKTTPKAVINDHREYSNDELEWKPDEPKKDNLTMLTEFCGDKKNDETVDKKQLLRFFEYYKPKANEWKGSFNIPQLFNRWITTAKVA